MAQLSILQTPLTFPPKRFLLIVWVATLVVSLYGFTVTLIGGEVVYVWMGIGIVAVWQLWTIRWVQVDNEGIRVKNVFQRGRELRWEEVTRVHEEEVRLNKGAYAILRLANSGTTAGRRAVKIDITSDLKGFDALRDIVHQAVPKDIPGEAVE
ncbi:MAG: PH domain-containing protein [Candidatus Kapaibacterium sp.]